MVPAFCTKLVGLRREDAATALKVKAVTPRSFAMLLDRALACNAIARPLQMIVPIKFGVSPILLWLAYLQCDAECRLCLGFHILPSDPWLPLLEHQTLVASTSNAQRLVMPSLTKIFAGQWQRTGFQVLCNAIIGVSAIGTTPRLHRRPTTTRIDVAARSEGCHAGGFFDGRR